VVKIASRISSHSARSSATGIILGLFFVVLAGRLFRLSYRYAVNIFFWDQWVFNNATLFQKHSGWQMFRWQFGPHRLGLGPLLSSLIEPHFRWNSRAESFLACTIVVVATACALFLKKRLFGELVIWDVAIPIVYLSAMQYESLFITSDLAHGPLPLLLLTLYCLAWTVGNRPLQYLLVLSINFVTTYTGFGLFLGFLTPILLLVDYWANLKKEPRGGLYLAAALLISGASLASFFYGYKLQPSVSCFSLKPQSPFRYVQYVTLMFANIFGVKGAGALQEFSGALVLLWLLWAIASAGRKMVQAAAISWVQAAVSATLVAYSLLFTFTTAFGRLCLGLPSAQSSRYSNYLALGIFGAYLHLVSLKPSTLRRVFLTVVSLALLASLPIRGEDRGTMRFFSEIKTNWRNCYLAGGSIKQCDTIGGYQIEPEPVPVLQRKLDYLKGNELNLFSGSK